MFTDKLCRAVMLEVHELRATAYVELGDVVVRAVKVCKLAAVVDVQPHEIVLEAVDAEELGVRAEV